ncbi:50S ribosomal protein L37ae [Candidatus Woesearchaeota archaeon CG_4_10_14_0_8_um_filter_47_5]|nr:MAG: 50S ribosomal protein L37ae [Candidatus Woesearchaeota archaeon CG_4_10_14_0_8_um_filter_47_5]
MGTAGAVKRFGVRYGRGVKQKFADVEVHQKKPQKCPYCNNTAGVKRIAVGIWHCKRCSSKFTGGAYYLAKN